jgi:ribonuclease VapC
MFADASAVVAILSQEDDEVSLLERIGTTPLSYSAMTIYEATLALARKADGDIELARQTVLLFLAAAGGPCLAIDEEISNEALIAFSLFGKGRHRAALNMGDCFSYACAKVHRVALLCKGDDFQQTDVRLA